MKIQINNKVVWLNYHHLYCLYSVFRLGGLGPASKYLGIGPSALSIQLKQFEISIGFKLFDRSHKKLSLNDSGLIVYSFAQEIFRLGNELVESVYDKPSPNRVHLQIGAINTIPKHLTLEIASMALNTKRCSIAILEDSSHALFEGLANHRLDLVITNSTPSASFSTLYSKRMARLPLWLVGTKKFASLSKKFPKSIQEVPMIVPTADSSVRHEIESYFKIREIEVDVVAEVQDVMVQKLLALKGVGVTVVPEFAVREYVKEKKLFLIGKLEDSYEELFIVTASRKIKNPIASMILKSFSIE